MGQIKISTFTLKQFDSKALGQLVSDEMMNVYGDDLEKLGEWFAKLDDKIIEGFFEAVSREPIPKKTASPRSKAAPTKKRAPKKAKPKPYEPWKSAKPVAKQKPAKAASPRARSPKPAKQPSLPFAGDEEEEPKTSPRRPPIATGDQLAADGNARGEVLAFLKSNPNVAASAIQSECSLSAGQTKGLLKRLREQGAIRVEGKNRGARYSLVTTNGAAAHA